MEVAQLDPASLTLWYNSTALSRSPNGHIYTAVIEQAINGDRADLMASIDGLPTESRPRGVQLAETIWHEKRHFLDLLLTNYGAFRVRQFWRVYINMQSILGPISAEAGELVFPLSTYADSVRMRQLGVKENPDLAKLGSNLASMGRWISEDRMAIKYGQGAIGFGGESQLEALAFLSQKAVSNVVFPMNDVLDADRDLRRRFGRPDMRYEWLHRLTADLGITGMRAVTEDQDGKEQVVVTGITLLGPLLVASLMSRHYGQEQVLETGGDVVHGSARPSYRLPGLLAAFQGREAEMRTWDFGDAWDAVNDVCTSLWGRTILEEFDADLEAEQELIDSVSGAGADEVVSKFLTGINQSRRALRTLLEESPQHVCDPLSFSATVDALDPLIVQVAPHGASFEPEMGAWTQLFGYHDTEGPETPLSRWWWATVWADNSPNSAVALPDRDNNMTVANYYAPITKLMLSGRRHRVMLDAETAFAEAKIAELVDFRYDPYYEQAHPMFSSADRIAYLAEVDGFTCDWCIKDATTSSCLSVSPWFFRTEELMKEILRRNGGTKAAYLVFIRDWSPYVLCHACASDLGVSQA